MRRAFAAALLVIAALVGGCGSGPSAEEVLAETADRLGDIRSGTLALSLTVAGRDGDPASAAGFELRGPFSLEGPGPLPVARLDYTQIAGAERETVTLISTGDRAFVEVDGRAFDLPPEQEASLRDVLEDVGEEGAGELPLDDWIEAPRLSDGGRVDGAATDRVDARLDVPAAVNALSALANGTGASAGGMLPRVTDADAEMLERSVRTAQLELRTGAEDRLLRRLAVDLDFALAPPPALQPRLGRLVGLQIDFRLGIDRVNAAVSVEAPEDVLPSSALPDPSGAP